MEQPTDAPTPTLAELEAARTYYESVEPRDLFYRAATELVDRAIREDTPLSLARGVLDGAIRDAAPLNLAEALAVLLRTWNSAFYRFHHRTFDAKHFADINDLVRRRRKSLLALRARSIESLSNADESEVKSLFAAFEGVLGPVGAAKALHLLAPRFFPLWDRAIAEGYHLSMKPQNSNDDNYWRFTKKTREQCKLIGWGKAIRRNPLKALDEFNYWRYTRKQPAFGDENVPSR
jgi:hypothetical protein